MRRMEGGVQEQEPMEKQSVSKHRKTKIKVNRWKMLGRLIEVLEDEMEKSRRQRKWRANEMFSKSCCGRLMLTKNPVKPWSCLLSCTTKQHALSDPQNYTFHCHVLQGSLCPNNFSPYTTTLATKLSFSAKREERKATQRKEEWEGQKWNHGTSRARLKKAQHTSKKTNLQDSKD